MEHLTRFMKGLRDGVPIGLGYLSVSIGIGIAAVAAGLNVITSLLISMTNLTSAGEAAGISVIAAGGTLIEMALVQLVINLRYSLMGISLSQKLDASFSTGHRLFLGAFITDEIFAVAVSQEKVHVRYMYGLVLVPYNGNRRFGRNGTSGLCYNGAGNGALRHVCGHLYSGHETIPRRYADGDFGSGV